MGLFTKKTTTKIAEMEDSLLDLQADINMGARKVTQEQKKAKDLLKKAMGAPDEQKRMLATQAKALYTSARAQSRLLSYRTAAYSMGMELKTALEVQELEQGGALRAFQKVLGAHNLKELEKVAVDINKDNEKMGHRLEGIVSRIEDMQDAYSGPELNDHVLLGIIGEMESLPPESVDKVLDTRLKAGA